MTVYHQDLVDTCDGKKKKITTNKYAINVRGFHWERGTDGVGEVGTEVHSHHYCWMYLVLNACTQSRMCRILKVHKENARIPAVNTPSINTSSNNNFKSFEIQHKHLARARSYWNVTETLDEHSFRWISIRQ